MSETELFNITATLFYWMAAAANALLFYLQCRKHRLINTDLKEMEELKLRARILTAFDTLDKISKHFKNNGIE